MPASNLEVSGDSLGVGLQQNDLQKARRSFCVRPVQDRTAETAQHPFESVGSVPENAATSTHGIRMVADALELPKVIEIEPTYSCNLRCRMCHVSFMTEMPRPTLDPAAIERLSGLRSPYVIVASGFEPMMHREFATIVRKLTAIDARIELISNGTLLTPETVSVLADSDLRMMTFSFDGILAPTYEHIRRRARYAPTIEAILDMRNAFRGRETMFCINSTMMKRNMVEMPAIVDFWDRADFDLVRFISMVVRENEPELIRESLYPVRESYYRLLDWIAEDVISEQRKITVWGASYARSSLAPRHPGNFDGHVVRSDNPVTRIVPNPRAEHQLGAGPGMSFPCRSPWTFAKILPNADVQLCYRFTVGNLAERSFEEIWRGAEAESVRNKVATERELCQTCDYFRFCLNSEAIDPDDVTNYFSESLLSGLPTIDFATGSMTLPHHTELPILVETIGSFNIVRFAGGYLCVPHALGPLDLQTVDVAAIPEIAVVATLHEARRLVRTGQVPSAGAA